MDSKNLIIFICAGSVVNYTYGEAKEIAHAITKPNVAAIDAYRGPMMQHSNESSATDAVALPWPPAIVTTSPMVSAAVPLFTLKSS